MEIRPILPRFRARDAGGVVICTALGRATLEGRLATLLPLWRALGRGRVVLIDDGTLTGFDRTRLARRCGDPEIRLPAADAFPAAPEWGCLLAALDGRRNAYWIVFNDFAGPPTERARIEQAIAANRSFALLGERALAPPESAPCLPAAPRLFGLAAGGDGRPLLAAVLARLEAAFGRERAREPEMAATAAGMVLAREIEPIVVPFVSPDAR